MPSDVFKRGMLIFRSNRERMRVHVSTKTSVVRSDSAISLHPAPCQREADVYVITIVADRQPMRPFEVIGRTRGLRLKRLDDPSAGLPHRQRQRAGSGLCRGYPAVIQSDALALRHFSLQYRT